MYDRQELSCGSCRRHRFENHRPEIHPLRLFLRGIIGQMRLRGCGEPSTADESPEATSNDTSAGFRA
jgi:hypothetical protein